jgi:hypothetical protein
MLLFSPNTSKNLKIKIYKTIILPVVLYDCETLSLTLREEFRLRIFENRILTRIFGLKRDENGEWRRLHNEELQRLYRSSNIIRVIKSRTLRWAGHEARMEKGRSAFKILTDKSTGKSHLGRSKRRREDNVKMDLKEISINRKNRFDSTHGRDYWRAFVNSALNFRIPYAME